LNFFGHAAVATWRSRQPGFVLGSMLPDFASMIRARPPSALDTELTAGIRYHHQTDHVFHDAASFRQLTAEAFVALQAAGLGRGSARAVAHVGVEILLDAELAKDQVARDAYLAALSASHPEKLGQHIGWGDAGAQARFELLRHTLIRRGVAADDATPELVAYRLERALVGRPRLELGSGGVAIVEGWAASARQRIIEQAPGLMRELGDLLITA
jgi:hypothetical protein